MDPQNNSGQPMGNPPQSSDHNLVLGVLAYLGPLSIVSYMMGKDDFTKFHAKQGIVLFGLEVIVWILASMMYSIWMLINVLNLATLILSIIGIVNVIQGHRKELPIIGGLTGSFGLK